LIKGFGFDKYNATLLNIPFGALQAVAILCGSYAASRFKVKSAMLIILALFGLAGSVMLYVANSGPTVNRTLALVGYYFLAFMFGTSPVVYSWAIANVGGQTKKSTMLSFMNCATATGQLTGPLLLNATDAPRYLPGVRSLMIAQGVLIAAVIAQVFVLWTFNKKRQAQRVANGKERYIVDSSMDRKFVQLAAAGPNTGVVEDRTDWQNDNFVYVY
jgi:predicted MFS family arabinose efflux permease